MFDLTALTIEEGLQHFGKVNAWTLAITTMLDRCGAGDYFYISTKDWGRVIVLHFDVPTFEGDREIMNHTTYEGDCEKAAEAAASVNTVVDFSALLNDSGIFTELKIKI